MRRLPCLLAAFGVLVAAAGCGKGGVRTVSLRPCKLRIASAEPLVAADLAAELPDGSLVVGTSHVHRSKLLIVLRRVSQDCRVVRSFGENGTATLSLRSRQLGAIDALLATGDGRLLLGGSDGRRELVARLLGDGRLDRAFGQDGWARIGPHEKAPRGFPLPAPIATSIAVGRGGTIFLGGNDQNAHCCVQDFVTELTARGEPVRAFGRGGSIVLPRFTGSYVTDVSVNGDGSVYALGEYEESGCGSPTILRVRPDGSFDARFDVAMARTVASVVSRRLRFTPTLVPRSRSGAFVLIGGLDKTCPPLAHSASGAAAIGIGASGRVDRSYGHDGETRFPSPGYAFESSSAIRLPSGRIVAAAFAYGVNGRPKGLIVRAFSRDGSIDRSFGRAGVRTILRKAFPRNGYLAALVPAANGGAWLVIGSRKQIDLMPVGG
jgi:hypothetical protein